MKMHSWAVIVSCVVCAVLLAVPATAVVLTQCPGYNGADINDDHFVDNAEDVDGDGMLRGAEINAAAPPPNSQVCVHLASGDGIVAMADTSVYPTADPDFDLVGRHQYVFGFANMASVDNGAGALKPIVDEQITSVGAFGANFPAPTLTLREGDDFYLSLTNVGMMMRPDLFDPHTVHFHGFPNASQVWDGVPDNAISINMGSTLTYYYHIVEPGTFMYHCHVEATEHMQMGMLGNLYVLPAQDGQSIGGYTTFAYNDTDGSTGYDVAFPIQLGAFDPDFHDADLYIQPLPFSGMHDRYFMLNGRGYPETVMPADLSAYTPNGQGGGKPSQKVNAKVTIDKTGGNVRALLRMSNLDVTDFYTVTILGMPMQVVGNGSKKLGAPGNTDQYYLTNSITLGGGESMDVIVDVTNVTPGTYFMYAANLDKLANDTEDFGGMMTEIEVK